MTAGGGRFIVVEGPEGAGKSTLTQGLVRRFRDRGEEVVVVREPGGTNVAERARQIAFDPAAAATGVAELFLVLAARADLVAKVIAPALEAGKTVLSDRYELSTRAYQIGGRRLPESDVLNANRLATGGLTPDLTIVLDLPSGVGRERQRVAGKALDRMEQEADELHERVADVFRRATGPGIVHIDAVPEPALVERTAWEAVCRLFGWGTEATIGGAEGDTR